MWCRFATILFSGLNLALHSVAVARADERVVAPGAPAARTQIHVAPVGADGERTRGNPDIYQVFHLEFNTPADRERFKMPDVAVVHAAGRWADVLLTVKSDEQFAGVWQALWTAGNDPNDAHGLRWAECAERIAVPAPRRDFDRLRAKPQIPIVAGGIDGLTGKGVIVVIIDTGIDFRHPDFVSFERGAPRSRLLYLWDTTEPPTKGVGKPAHLRYPNGQPVGTIYSRDELSADLTLQSGSPRVRARDADGHGTACAGIAAGNGQRSNGDLPGVAPNADLIGIRVAVGGEFVNGYLLGAFCEWVDSVADGRPYVISCSFGGRSGSADGMRIEERQLEAYFPASAVGRALCISAGNEGDWPMHADLKIPAGGSRTLSWGGGEKEGYLRLFFGAASGDSFTLTPGPGLVPDGYFLNPLVNQMYAAFGLPAAGSEITIQNNTQAELTGDAYITFGDGPQRGFEPRDASAARQIGSPGSALAAITVASYDWYGDVDHMQKRLEVGAISSYSSRGPLRTGDVVKPDITAPGQWFAAPGSGDVEYDWRGQYRWMNGTSAAAPYVAGIVALMLEKNPKLTCGEIRALIQKHASQDSFTGSVPNGTWGYGKLDIAAVKRILAAIP